MKKVISSLLLALITAGLSVAETVPREGFYDNNILRKRATVEEALKMKDNSYVTIKGNIVQRLSSDNYIFRDETGSITVEIDSNKWQGQVANPKDKLELSGEIERNFKSVKLDVDNVRKLPQ